MKVKLNELRDMVRSLLSEGACPTCGTSGAYIGLNNVECRNPACRNYVPEQQDEEDAPQSDGTIMAYAKRIGAYSNVDIIEDFILEIYESVDHFEDTNPTGDIDASSLEFVEQFFDGIMIPEDMKYLADRAVANTQAMDREDWEDAARHWAEHFCKKYAP